MQAFGPVTGDAIVSISGVNLQDFVGKKAKVRFACAKGSVDNVGEVVDKNTVQCETPAFMKYGPVDVEVRVSLDGKPFTNTALPYKFHSVTDSAVSMAFGPGIQKNGAPGVKTVFYIRSLDTSGKPRDTGGDVFTVKVKCDSDVKKTKKTAAIITKVEDIEVADNKNGTYTVSYTAPKADGYKVHVDFDGTFQGEAGPVRGSPFQATFIEGASPKNNTLDGPMVAAYIKERISSTKDFCNKTLRGLKKQVESGDLDQLIKTKEFLRSVDQRKVQNDYDLDTIKTMLEYIKQTGATGGKGADRDLKALAGVASSWADVETQAPITFIAIVPETKSQAAAQQEKIVAYTKKLDRDTYNFKQHDFWTYDHGAEKSRQAMKEETVRLKKERKEMEHLANLCSLFEFPDAINKAREYIEEQENSIEWMGELWNIIESSLDFFNESKACLWSEVKADDLEDEVKRSIKNTKACNKNIRWCKAYQGIDKANKDFLNTMPLISSLHHEAVRLRHWGQLQKAAGKEFTPPPEDPNCTLGYLLDLGLHNFSADVEEICDGNIISYRSISYHIISYHIISYHIVA